VVSPAVLALPASIPSPSQGVWHLGPFPLRGYALCIIAGIVVAVWVAGRRWVARGGRPGLVTDVAVWAVPFGIVGGRLYHVVTSWQPYFAAGGHPLDALKIWQGGLGIWGAIVLGGVGAWVGCVRQGVRLPPFADAMAPGLALAQAIGRWGNWFNQELFGRPTTLPWGLRIDPAHRPPGYAQYATFHPTFLYESLWCLGAAAVVVWADRRFRLGHGRAFMLYVAVYCVGRSWFELLRIDDANHILGLRVNTWVAGLVLVGAVVAFVWSARTRPGRETPAELLREPPAGTGQDGAAEDAADAETADPERPSGVLP
jgi:prolipoprotein diacylglyceryl transferase